PPRVRSAPGGRRGRERWSSYPLPGCRRSARSPGDGSSPALALPLLGLLDGAFVPTAVRTRGILVRRGHHHARGDGRRDLSRPIGARLAGARGDYLTRRLLLLGGLHGLRGEAGPEDLAGHNLADALAELSPHVVGFVLVDHQRILLREGAEANALAQFLGRGQVLHPHHVDRTEGQ